MIPAMVLDDETMKNAKVVDQKANPADGSPVEFVQDCDPERTVQRGVLMGEPLALTESLLYVPLFQNKGFVKVGGHWELHKNYIANVTVLRDGFRRDENADKIAIFRRQHLQPESFAITSPPTRRLMMASANTRPRKSGRGRSEPP